MGTKPTRNSNLDPDEARAQGKCGDCGGHGQFTQVFMGKRSTVTCRACGGSGRA
jgi:DnaJ-class molecular chaperone